MPSLTLTDTAFDTLGRHEQAAMLTRCGITITPLWLPVVGKDDLIRYLGVYQGGDCLDLFMDDGEAWAFAVEQAEALIEAEAVGEITL